MNPRNFQEFWPYYLGEHRNPVCRALHYFGTSGSILLLAAAIVTLNPWLFAIFLPFGYAFAWIGHFFVEKNKPASFKYPLWSFGADQKMLFCFLTGRMGAEMAQIAPAQSPTAPQPA